MKTAIVLGGSESCHEELANALELAPSALVLACNDHIQEYSGECVGVTLQGVKIKGWLLGRQTRKYPRLQDLWFYEPHVLTTRMAECKWRGSVGLFGVQIALECLAMERVMLAGVPMTTVGGHFIRQQRWVACDHFWPKWAQWEPQMRGKVRSFSGRTAELLGVPDREWLQTQEATVAA
jgi:hypothetical protein